MTTRTHKPFYGLFLSLLTSLALSTQVANAAALAITQTPLFLSSTVAPNVIMTLDDSGSMCWGFTPGASGYSTNTRGPFTTPALVPGYGNGLYYNPRTVYTIPQRVDLPTRYYTSFASAWQDGFNQTLASVDLSQHYSPTTGSYCNNSPQATYTYTCNATFGLNAKSCSAVFSTPSASFTKTCSSTDFIRNSYSSSCRVSFSRQGTSGNRTYYIIANSCTDTSAPPFQGLNPGGTVTIGNQQYTLTTSQLLPANGTTEVQIVNPVQNSGPYMRTVSWNQGNDTISCNDSNSKIFGILPTGTNVSVTGNNNNNGSYTVASNSDATIAVTTHVKYQTGVQATFNWTTGSNYTITTSGCGANPFQGLTTGNSITVSGTQNNNNTFTLAAAPSSNYTVLTVTGGLTNEFASNVNFSWAASSANLVTVSNCTDYFGDPNNTPFSTLSSGNTVTISGSGSNDGSYTLSQNPTNSNTTLSMTTNFPSASTASGVTFTWPNPSYTGTTGGEAAYYHLYYADLASVSGTTGASIPSACTTDSRSNSSCYIKVVVGSANDVTYSGWASAALSEQNFANWYSFYRTRALSVMTGANEAVGSFGEEEVRLAWQTINRCKTFTGCTPSGSSTSYDNSMRPLTDSHRTDFYNWLEKFVPSGSTPMRSAMNRAGVYYQQSGLNGPYVKDPGHDQSAYSFDGTTTELSCRKDFHILFTDGYWNSDSNFSIGGNIDNTSIGALPDSKSFAAPTPPFSDGNSDNLSDIAFYYWSHDLRTDLTNNVPAYNIDQSTNDNYWNPKNDPATWQHMINFTIGLGLSSDLGSDWAGNCYTGAYSDFLAGTKSWPATSADSPGNVYDLWHAALNSRGQFFSADTADAVSTAFKDIVNAIRVATPSAAAVAANSTSIQTNTLVYQATFDSSDWSGHLKAIQILSTGAIGSTVWDAATLLPSYTSRNILTLNAATNAGSAFDSANCTTLSTAQQAALNNCNANLINYLRGDTSNEIRYTSTPGYRNRSTTVLGDIINSDPAYVYNADYGYTSAGNLTADERNSYSAYVVSKTASGKHPMVYVGSNDGMLHAFNAENSTANGGGSEVFAYIPAAVYPNLAALANTTFSHHYMVDGAPTVGDAYIGGAWKTYLVGGLNAGGQSVYALDITNPESFSATNVKWEFSDSNGLGYTYSKPQIGRLTNGTWVAIFGNGYNSTAGHASLYVVNLSTGALIKQLDTSALDTNTATDNGLSSPALYINNGVVETVYAGDLHGNLWKFDLSDSDPNNWQITRLFAATNFSNQAQAITAQPAIGTNTSGGNMVYFGTGRYLTSTDPADMTVQSFYAIWDKPGLTNSGTTPSVGIGDLQQQYIYSDSSTSNTTQYGYYVRETTSNIVDYTTKLGWFMDLLPYTATTSGSTTTYTSGTPQGERVRSVPLLKYGRIIFVTLIPSTDPCEPGGQSWLMEINALNGAATTTSSFDFNNDNKFNSSDLLSDGKVASGIMLSAVGIATTPTWLEQNPTKAVKVITGSSGATVSIGNKGGSGATGTRVYWQQIQ